MTDGCGTSIACGSMLTRMARGRAINEVKKITNIRLIDALDGLPDENKHCAKLAVDTLQKAIEKYLDEIKNCRKRYPDYKIAGIEEIKGD